MTFGEKLRLARSRSGLTQKELAHSADLTQRSIAAYETDKGHPRVSTVDRIAAALRLSPDLFLRDDADFESSLSAPEPEPLPKTLQELLNLIR